MYGSHGMAFGNNPAVLRQMSSAGSGGQKTGHPEATSVDDFNTHGVHGDNSAGSSGGAPEAPPTGPNDVYTSGYPAQGPGVDYKKGS